jgi:hypothetical protein
MDSNLRQSRNNNAVGDSGDKRMGFLRRPFYRLKEGHGKGVGFLQGYELHEETKCLLMPDINELLTIHPSPGSFNQTPSFTGSS